MNVWKILIAKERKLLYFLNGLSGIYLQLTTHHKKELKRSNAKFIASNIRKNRAIIIMNGPSINEQDFNLLVGEDVIFANRGFKHPLYKKIQPKYHVFVDSKIKNGIWPITWLDEILEMVPNITFVMPAQWASIPMLQPYVKKGVKFLWLFDNHTFVGGMGCAGAAIRGAIAVGYKDIYITGFEKTGFANELLKSASHFYGINEENNIKTWDDYTQDFFMNFVFYIGAKVSAEDWKNKGINIYNITKGGVVEVFERRDFNNVLKK